MTGQCNRSAAPLWESCFFLIVHHRGIIGAFRSGFDAATRLHRSVRVETAGKKRLPFLRLFASLP